MSVSVSIASLKFKSSKAALSLKIDAIPFLSVFSYIFNFHCFKFSLCIGFFPILPWMSIAMKRYCCLVFIYSFIHLLFNQYWFWSKYSRVLSRHVLTFLWVDRKVHGWFLLTVNFRLKVAGVGRRLPSKRSAEWRVVAPDGTLQLTPSGERHIWSDAHFCSVGEPVRLAWKHFFGEHAEKNADSQNSISDHSIHFLLQFRVVVFGFVSLWTSVSLNSHLKSRNEKVLLIDENLRTSRSVKTVIKQKKWNKRTAAWKCLWPC